jgi:hypothetical protein
VLFFTGTLFLLLAPPSFSVVCVFFLKHMALPKEVSSSDLSLLSLSFEYSVSLSLSLPPSTSILRHTPYEKKSSRS